MCKDSIIEQKREAFKNKTISLCDGEIQQNKGCLSKQDQMFSDALDILNTKLIWAILYVGDV